MYIVIVDERQVVNALVTQDSNILNKILHHACVETSGSVTIAHFTADWFPTLGELTQYLGQVPESVNPDTTWSCS